MPRGESHNNNNNFCIQRCNRTEQPFTCTFFELFYRVFSNSVSQLVIQRNDPRLSGGSLQTTRKRLDEIETQGFGVQNAKQFRK